MATRSAIGIKTTDNRIMSVYCHWDGYPSHNGAILAENYTDADKIVALLSLGDISSLGPEIGVKHPFETFGLSAEQKAQYEKMTTFYGRDRSETDVGFRVFDTVKDFVEHYDEAGAEYFYLFDENKWLVSAYRNEFKNLNQVLAEETV